MGKKILIISGFIAIFALAVLLASYLLLKKQPSTVVQEQKIPAEEVVKTDEMHVYSIENLVADCFADDKIFCAVERTVKCTLAPELASCDKEFVPGFILGQTGDTERPTQISFKITKIKPIPDSSDISVYTESDCDALWFGLCKGTVIYSLNQKKNGEWGVTDMFALE